ncbi:hypothetical protein [Geopsychrobacter electrodiphilus]|nr:hypothetical protein [Geopsychrobacter electrodiphilus]
MSKLTVEDVKRIKGGKAKTQGGQIRKGDFAATAESIVAKRDQQKRRDK